ncbi:Uncharacterized protein TCM_031061 [Theobroma cacao]|uniref:Uncharacterized protein n=1 Tax=Theobroma cacao TaxID=3641 RepID=A0A061F595_THECC|nr:Uncharacterized protein TCM_031061 [Theobroma cacao]
MVSASVPDIISDFLRIFNADYAPNVKVGFVDTTGKLYIQTLQVADIFMFLKALVHYQCNPNPDQPAMADWIIGLKLSLCHVLTIVPTFLPDSTDVISVSLELLMILDLVVLLFFGIVGAIPAAVDAGFVPNELQVRCIRFFPTYKHALRSFSHVVMYILVGSV